MLSIRVCSAYASEPDAYAQHAHQFLTRMLSMVCRELFQIWNFYTYAEHTRKKLVRMLSIRVRTWPVCSGYASVPGAYAQHLMKGMHSVHALVPDAYAQCMHQFLTCKLSVCISSWHACQHVHQFLKRMLSARINSLRACWGYTKWTFEKYENWCACWACASGTDAYAQGAHQFLTRTLRVRISSWPVCSACA